jgi:hypothetical protein
MACFEIGSRRRAWAAALAAGLMLAGCVGSGSLLPPRPVGRSAAAAPPPPPPVEEFASAPPVGNVTGLPSVGPRPAGAGELRAAESGNMAIGNGPVRVALILPLTGQGQSAVAAQSLKNAADLALAEAQGRDLTLLVKDDRGTPEGGMPPARPSPKERS